MSICSSGLISKLRPSYEGKQVLITGGLGFLGSNLSEALLELGARVTLLDSTLKESGSNLYNIEPWKNQIRLIEEDLGSTGRYGSILSEVDYIFNFAGTLSHVGSMEDPVSDLWANTESHVRFLEAVRKTESKAKILYSATRGQYGVPKSIPVKEDHPLNSLDVNGINKTAGEAYHLLYAKHYGVFTCSLRLSNCFGPRHQMRNAKQGVLNWFVRQALDSGKISVFGTGQQKRDVSFVDDVVEAFLLTLATDSSKGEVFNLGGTPSSLKDFAQKIVELVPGSQVELRQYPGATKAVEIGDYVADYSKLHALTGWEPRTSLKSGLEKTISFYQQNRSHYW